MQYNNELIPVEGRENLARDPFTHAVINTNVEAYKAAVDNYKRQRAEKEKIEALENDINNIKEDMSDIKNMLQMLLKKDSK